MIKYKKHTWLPYEDVTSGKMNNIEEGIYQVTKELSSLHFDNASTSAAGLMSAGDKQIVNTVGAMLENNREDFVDTLQEVLAAFDTFAQGGNVATVLSQKQATLESGVNIKTINGQSVLGSGDLITETHHTFPNTWTVNSSTTAFCASIESDSSAVAGTTYLGTLGCSDLPSSMGQAEAVVEIISTGANGKCINITLSSLNVAPYKWTYSYGRVDGNVVTSGWQGIQPELVSGTNIKTINNQSILGSGNISLTKSSVGLSNVDNTSDASKKTFFTGSISSGNTGFVTGGDVHSALSNKQATLVSGNNIKTINGESILGSGNITVSGGSGGGGTTVIANPTFTGGENSLNGIQIGNDKYRVNNTGYNLLELLPLRLSNPEAQVVDNESNIILNLSTLLQYLGDFTVSKSTTAMGLTLYIHDTGDGMISFIDGTPFIQYGFTAQTSGDNGDDTFTISFRLRFLLHYPGAKFTSTKNSDSVLGNDPNNTDFYIFDIISNPFTGTYDYSYNYSDLTFTWDSWNYHTLSEYLKIMLVLDNIPVDISYSYIKEYDSFIHKIDPTVYTYVFSYNMSQWQANVQIYKTPIDLSTLFTGDSYIKLSLRDRYNTEGS